jgi:O-antigen/teichoic acid export membrane protein
MRDIKRVKITNKSSGTGNKNVAEYEMAQQDNRDHAPSVFHSAFKITRSRIASFIGSKGDTSKRLRRISHLLAGNFFGTIIGLASFALIARALGPADYGILALCFSFARAVERLVSFQSWQPLIKYGADALQNKKQEDLRSLLKFGLLLDIGAALLGFVLAAALLIFASPLIGISSDVRTFALLYCTVLPFQISGMPTAVLRLYGKFAALAYGQVISSTIRLVLCVLGLLFSWGLLQFTLMWMIIQIFSSLTMNFLAFRELHRQGVKNVLSSSIQGMSERFPGLWRFALSANLSLTIRSSAFELDTLLVGFLADPAAAGFYHIAKRVGRIGTQAGSQVQAVVFPELARLWSGKRFDAFKRVVRHTELMLASAGVGLVLVIFLTIEPVLRFVAGPSFSAAAPLVTVQAIAVMMTLIGTVMRSALLSMGLQSLVLYSVLASTAVFHVTAISLIPMIGPMGANIAHIALAIIWTTLMFSGYRRHIRVASITTLH